MSIFRLVMIVAALAAVLVGAIYFNAERSATGDTAQTAAPNTPAQSTQPQFQDY